MTGPQTRIPAILAPAPVFHGSGITHAGRVRERNEDSILTDPAGILWAVADGMGGYGHGDVASDIVIDCLSALNDAALAGPELRMALETANRRIMNGTRDRGGSGMGATVVAMMIQNSMATIAWVGDCRAYLMRRGNLRLLTHDHTVVQDMVDQGLLRETDREGHPESHVVTRAVGFDTEVEVDLVSVPLVPGDRLMLCSDGLTACLGDHQIAHHMAEPVDPDRVCRELVTSTLEAGAPDNVSVICVEAEEA